MILVRKKQDGKNKRTEKKDREVKNETLKVRFSSRRRTENNRKATEGLSRLSRE